MVMLEDTVDIYNSMRSTNVTCLKDILSSFGKPTNDFIHFDVLNIAGQTNSNDCGFLPSLVPLS